jgi:polyphosphate kinase 2 (PPK2 family)
VGSPEYLASKGGLMIHWTVDTNSPKFWLHIDPDEQLRRFKEREQISYKQHKITEEDYRNRDK